MKKIILVFLLFCFCASSVSAINASFTAVQTGSNIVCTSTSTGTITRYKWSVTLNNSIVGTTGWVSESAVTSYTYTFQDGGWVQFELCVGNSTTYTCATKSLGYVTGLKDKYPCEHYKSRKLCEDAGYYWYNNSCNCKDEILPWNVKKPLQGADDGDGEFEIRIGEYKVNATIMIIIGIVLLLLIFNRRK